MFIAETFLPLNKLRQERHDDDGPNPPRGHPFDPKPNAPGGHQPKP